MAETFDETMGTTAEKVFAVGEALGVPTDEAMNMLLAAGVLKFEFFDRRHLSEVNGEGVRFAR